MVKEFAGLTSDSRKVKPGYLFAALSGSTTDGARFVQDAVARGATAVLGVPVLADTVTALGARFIPDGNPRRALAKLAAAFFGAQPQTVAAVTGTKGKSSIVAFLREIWTTLGLPAASLGTVGVIGPNGAIPLNHTTPDPVEIQQLLAQLKRDGVDHLAIEASSHGLDQHRLDGVVIAAAGFTNITRDHMDYHSTFDHYLAAKLRLFTDVVKDGGIAVVNADAEHAQRFIDAAKGRGLTVMTVGRKGETIHLDRREDRGGSQALTLTYQGKIYHVDLPQAGDFQASNALVAAGLAIGLGADAAKVFAALGHLKGAPGRMEKVAFAASGAPIYVDYAHTPDSLEKVLEALRPHTSNRLHVVFGCGGDRDKGKRPLMGAIAVKLADDVIVTDDNPRTEDAETIRREILAAAPGAREIGDRAAAIRAAVAELKVGDVLIIAGKGHETGQYIKGEVFPFSDREQALADAQALGGRARMSLFTSAEAETATLGKASQPFAVNGLSIDTRTLQPGDLFVALQGDNRDGHDFVKAAFDAKAGAALVSRALDVSGPLLAVAHTQRGLEDLARAARARSNAKIAAVTGSAGKTTTKEILRISLNALGRTHASAASYNNHWGVPLSLAALPRDAEYGVFEVGMNHFGELRNLVGFVKPHVALVTTIAPAHLEFFGSCEAIADAKSEIFEGLLPGGAGLIPADSPYADRLVARARQAQVSRIVTFGETGEAKLITFTPDAAGMRVKADIFGTAVDCLVGAPGAHIAQNVVGALATVALLDGDVLNAAAALKAFAPLKGRGARFDAAGIAVIDESYNANPASMAAALALLGAASGRKIAVLGDMLEMGEGGIAYHAGLTAPIAANDVDLVFASGAAMKALWDALPANRRGGYAPTSAELKPLLLAALKPGDTVLVKGSNGARMSVIVEALREKAA